MADKSKIEWTEATWNPILGCDKVSAGCKNCYAIRTAWRLQHNPNPKVAKAFEGLTVIQGGQPKPNWTGLVNFVEERLEEPLKWKKPRRIFVNSQSDLFHEGVSDDSIQKIFKVMCSAKRHTFQVLTKRPERMQEFLSRWDSMTRDFGPLWPHTWPQNHIWLGVSCENQATADERIPLLLQTPAAVRWISAEPLLGPVSLEELPSVSGIGRYLDSLSNAGVDPGAIISTKLNWVVAGGESGPGARPMQEEWARSLMQQCKAAGVPFFMKQGAKANWPDFKNFDSFPKDLQVREYPQNALSGSVERSIE